MFITCDYTLERDNRELQLAAARIPYYINYTLERDNRELQHARARTLARIIIPLREIIGNYNA